MLNKVTLIGRLGKDPEVKQTQLGAEMATLMLVTNKGWKDKATGEKKRSTEWHKVVIFSEPLAKVAKDYCAKGGLVFIEGEIKTRRWNDNSGATRYSTDIILQGTDAKLIMLERAGEGAQEDGEELDDEVSF